MEEILCDWFLIFSVEGKSDKPKLVLGIQLVRLYVHDTKPIIIVIIFALRMLAAIALRIYRRIHGGDG